MKSYLKKQLLIELEQNWDTPVSGEELAIKFGVTRSAVWKAIKSLVTDGYKITAVPNRGYTLLSGSDVLSEDLIRSKLGEGFNDLSIFTYDSIDSTNTQAKRLLSDDASAPFLVTAGEQTAGRGRLGRQFYSPSGTGAYMTLVVPSEIEMNASICITAAAAVAVVRAIDSLTGKRAQIKWVNDIYLDDKKICGILTEASADVETGTFKYIIIGIGINISTDKFPADISAIAGSLSAPELTRTSLIAEIAKNVLKITSNLSDKGFISDYRERSLVIGQKIDFYKKGEKYTALATGIDDEGGLEVLLPDGKTDTLRSGEITVRVRNE